MPSGIVDVSTSFSLVSPADIVASYINWTLLPRISNSSTRAFPDCLAVKLTFKFFENGFGLASRAVLLDAASSPTVATLADDDVLALETDEAVQISIPETLAC